MSQIGFGSGAGFIDDLAEPATAELLCKTKGQLDDMFHRLQAQIGSDPKRSFVGTHEPSDVDQYRNDGK